MRSDQSLATLEKIAADIKYGFTATASEAAVGPKFVRITDILGGSIDWERTPYCEFDGDAEKFGIREGDLLIARIGASAGTVARVDREEEAVFASYLVRVRVRPEVADDRFVGFVLQSPRWNDYVARTRGGSAQPQFNGPLIKRFTFPLPPLREQPEPVKPGETDWSRI